MYLMSLTVSDGQSPTDSLPDGVIERFTPGASVYTLAFSPDGEILASGGDNNAVILWDVADRSKRESFIEHGKSVMSIAFSPDGQFLASASLDGYVRLWHVSSEHSRVSLRHGGWVESVAFSPDGKMLASGGGDQEGSVRLWNVLQSRSIATFSGHGALVEFVTFSPDGRLLASASRDGTIKLWDIANQRMLRTLAGHSSVVHAVVFSPDGETLASSSRDKTIRLWKVSSGENFTTFEIRNSLYVYAEALAFSPDGQFLASACVDYTVRLWNVVERREVNVLTGHHGGVTSVAFSPDGQLLASGSRDRAVLLWDLSYFGVEVPPLPVPNSEDTAPPEIAILSPMERVVDSTVRQVPVEVSVSDDSRIAEVQIDGRKASLLEDGIFSATIPLNQGKNEIRITATDTYGNVGTYQFIVEKPYPILEDPTPPEIVIHSPASRDARVAAVQFTIEGSVTDDNGVNEVRVDDVGATISADGVFTTIVQLFEGENLIPVTATDTSGNMGTDQLTIIRDTTGPEIHILSPADSAGRGFQPPAVLPTGSVLVSGTVTDPSGVIEVKVNETVGQIRGDRFEATVPLVYEDDLIRVTATDTLGNQAFKDVIIPPPRKDYALLFAVDTYAHWPGLKYPFLDAVKIGRDLEDIYGFQVELVHNPTKMDIHRVLRRYVQKEYTPEDQLLIFFAGHGDFDQVTNMGYLVCQDTKKPDDDSFRISYFSHSDFRDIIDRMSCEHILLVLDTCYSGTFDERLAMRGDEENMFDFLSQVDIERKLTYTTRWYFTSGAKEQVPDYSLFVRAFLDALRSEGGRDNILTIKETLTYIEKLSSPKPCSDGFGRNAPGSDFLFIKKVEN